MSQLTYFYTTDFQENFGKNNQLYTHFYNNNLMPSKQFGFTRGRSTTDASVELVKHICCA